MLCKLPLALLRDANRRINFTDTARTFTGKVKTKVAVFLRNFPPKNRRNFLEKVADFWNYSAPVASIANELKTR